MEFHERSINTLGSAPTAGDFCLDLGPRLCREGFKYFPNKIPCADVIAGIEVTVIGFSILEFAHGICLETCFLSTDDRAASIKRQPAGIPSVYMIDMHGVLVGFYLCRPLNGAVTPPCEFFFAAPSLLALGVQVFEDNGVTAIQDSKVYNGSRNLIGHLFIDAFCKLPLGTGIYRAVFSGMPFHTS